ncbi:hypothetical protein [Brucella intermedia]|nr:hypothetical protein [Brucella intermedia]
MYKSRSTGTTRLMACAAPATLVAGVFFFVNLLQYYLAQVHLLT